MKSDRIAQKAHEIGARAAAQHCERLCATPLPNGVRAECVDGGVQLSGKCLRLRMLNDPLLRNFAR